MNDHIIDEIGRLIDGLNWLWNNVLIPLIQWLIENVDSKYLQPIVAWIGDTLLSIAASVTGMANSVLKQLDGIIQFLTGVFTGIAKALSGILLYVEGFKQNINIISLTSSRIKYLDPLSKMA